MNALVAALGRADGPRTAAIAGLGFRRVVAAFAERDADGMNGRQVDHVEAHLGDVGQALFAIGEGAVLGRDRASVERGKNSYHALNRARTGSTTMLSSRSDSVAKRLSG